MVTAGLIGLGVLGFFSYVSGLGWGWVTILGTPGVVRSWASPTTGIAFLVTGIAHLFHVDVGVGGVLSVCRFLGLLGAAVAGVWLLLNSDRIGTLKALGTTLLLFVLLGPVVQPWYLSWGLILLAPVALGQLRSLVIGLSMVTAFIELPGGTQLVTTLFHGDPLLIVLTLLWLLIVLTVPLSSWDRRPAAAGRRAPRPPPSPPGLTAPAGPGVSTSMSSPSPPSIRCSTATSSHRLNFRPISRSTPTCSNPQARCSAIEALLSPPTRAIIEWNPWRVPSRTSSSSRARPTPSPRWSPST